MTVAVAALFPWQELVDSLSKSRWALIQGIINTEATRIILAADSRWSYKIGVDYDDGGVKLAKIDSHAAAVYAGNTAAGEKAFARLAQEFSQKRKGILTEPVDPQHTLQTIWQQYKHQGGGLWVSLGFIDGAGTPHLFSFDHINDFSSREVTKVQAIGAGAGYFVNRLDNEVCLRLSKDSFAWHVDEWVTIISCIISEMRDQQIDPTVGGPILSAIITRNGVQGRSLYSINPDVENPLVRLRRHSLTEPDVKSFYERQRR